MIRSFDGSKNRLSIDIAHVNSIFLTFRPRSRPDFGVLRWVLIMPVTMLIGCSQKAPPAKKVPPPAPVTVAVVETGAQPMIVTGLGHVQGFNTAVARAQTSGQLIRVHFAEGQGVRAGQPLAEIDPRPLQATLAQDMSTLARDRAALVNAQDQVKRYAPLVAQGLASAQQVETFRAQAAQLAATVTGDQATIARDQLTLGYTTIRAPIAGVTGVRLVDVGNVVSPADQAGLVTIAQVQPIAVTFTLPQASIGEVRAALSKTGKVGLPVEAVGEGQGGKLDQGRLSVVDNRIDPTSGSILLKALFPNGKRLLWPGQLITARLTLGVSPDTVTVPASAVQRGPKGTYVWIVDPQGKAAMHPVAMGRTLGERIAVAKGLNGGERVITDGQFGLQAGQLVRIVPASTQAAPIKSDNPDQLGIRS